MRHPLRKITMTHLLFLGLITPHLLLLEYTTGVPPRMQTQTAGILLAVATLPALLKGMMKLMLLVISQAAYL